MKIIFTFFVLSICVNQASAQWSDLANKFYDSLHMRITDSAGRPSQLEIIKSEPAGSTIIFWQDTRTSADIYAQKVSADGQFLWPVGGLPVATGSSPQYMRVGPDANDRDITFGCSDGSGGFYVCWQEDLPMDDDGNHFSRIRVQHVLSDGTLVFPPDGQIVSNPVAEEDLWPQIVTDANGGFFIAYLHGLEQGKLIVRCLKDVNGTLKEFGGGNAANYVRTTTVQTPCGPQQLLDSTYSSPWSFKIYPDLQGGCNVVITAVRSETNHREMATYYNHLVRVKKDSRVTLRKRLATSGSPVTFTNFYPKDTVVILHTVRAYSSTNNCQDPAVTSWYLQNNGQGVVEIDGPARSMTHPDGTTVRTTGNININVMAWNHEDSPLGTMPPGVVTKILSQSAEMYDSIPFQLTSDIDHPEDAYRIAPPTGTIIDTVNEQTDTLFHRNAREAYSFGLMSTGNRIIATAKIRDISPILSSVYLQEFKVEPAGLHRFHIGLATTDPDGVLITRERGGQFFEEADTSLRYGGVYVRGDSVGNAVICLEETWRYIRVSPLDENGKLRWGATGKPIGTGIVNNWLAFPGGSVLNVDEGGKAVIAFADSREEELYSNYNLYMRHLDSLDVAAAVPPLRMATLLQQGTSTSVPAFLGGNSDAWTTIETREYHGPHIAPSGSTPVAEIFDDFPLREVTVQAYQHTGAARTYDSKPYLNRNWTINVGNKPAGTDSVDVRLIFTNEEFRLLKLADPSITTPAGLEVIKQPNETATTPATYEPVQGETRLPVRAWAKIDSGYYVQVRVGSFSNFFIRKDPSAVLPVTWLGIAADRLNANEVSVGWDVAMEKNVKRYVVQSSTDGRMFNPICEVGSNNSESASHYSCVVNAGDQSPHYFRVLQVDIDGRSSYSNTILLPPALKNKDMFVGPNPASHQTTLTYTTAAGVRSATLYNPAGVPVWRSATTVPPAGSLVIPLQRLTAGLYLLEVRTNEGKQTFRILHR